VAYLVAALIGLAVGGLVVVYWQRLTRRGLPEIRPLPARSARVPEAVVAELSTGVVAVDESDTITLVNQAAFRLGIAAGAGLVADVRKIVRQVRRDGVRRDVRLTIKEHGLGRRALPLEVTVLSLGGNDVVVLALDVTEHDRVEAVRRDFVANVGHEIKTPVGAIALLAEAALDARDDREAVERFLHRLQHEADRLTRLVRELIELSRLQGGEPLPSPTRVLVDDVVDEASDQVKAAAESKNITIDCGGDRGVEVLGSRAQLVTALNNLLDNAVAYSGSGTRVAVGVHRRSQTVEIAVADEGIGIARDDQGRIFERFYRADPARSRATGGTGLGLAIVKHIVGNHGGAVSVSSRVGVGSTFTMRLPAYTAAAVAARPLQEVST
jgi:two-component system, OmpR family, sensor histidine kinase SenX3